MSVTHQDLHDTKEKEVEIGHQFLCINDIIQVVQKKKQAFLSQNEQIRKKINASHQRILAAVEKNEIIYGVTTNFGGMANTKLEHEQEYFQLQRNLLWGLKCSIGKKLPKTHIQAGMLIRANALAKGVSGIRAELIERLLFFIKADITPIVRHLGSIGASGDLIPLAQIAGAILGLGAEYFVDYQGKEISVLSVLKQHQLEPLQLKPKEGLALINGTSMMSGIAAHCVHESEKLFSLSLHAHAFFIQSLLGMAETFDPFIHEQKSHPGQVLVATRMRQLLAGSSFIISEENKHQFYKPGALIQDRYSIRCLSQYLGVIAEGIQSIKNQVEQEINSADDNPLIDVDRNLILHGGNFLGQYIGIGMDQLRHYLALVVKHLDVQIALVVSPEFNRELPASLAAQSESGVRFGLKGLQICANSIMPLMLHLANPITHLYPTHAEQFNQNINSQGFSAANLAWESIELMRYYLAATLIFSVQAVDLRTYTHFKNYNTRAHLSPALIPLYEVIYQILGQTISCEKPLIVDNSEHCLDHYIQVLVADLSQEDSIILKTLSH